MIERFDGGSSEAKNMIDIQFQQTASLDKTSKLKLGGCIFILLATCHRSGGWAHGYKAKIHYKIPVPR